MRVSEASAAISLTVGEIASSDKTLLAKTGRVLPTILGTPATQRPVRYEVVVEGADASRIGVGVG